MEDFGGAGRSAMEKKISAAIGKMGEAGDQGGHAAALRFFKNLQREDFLFPQNGNLNMGAFRRLEQDYANALKVEGTEVHFKHELLNWDSNRPKAISVDTQILRDGKPYTEITQVFENKANQTYKSIINKFGYLR